MVTGAASGIGRAAVELLRSDAPIVAIDLSEQPGDLEPSADLAWIEGDVTDGQTWDRVASAAASDSAGVQALVACAADVVVAPFLATTLEEWRRLFEINVLGVLRGMQALMPAMVERGQGAIAVVCSVDSFFAEDSLSAYSTTKAALLHLVRSAALEHARDGLQINAVCPGAVDTELLRRHLEALDDPAAARRAIERRTPAGRIISPREIAEVLRFLIGPGASGLSGAALTVDAGLTTTYDYENQRTDG